MNHGADPEPTRVPDADASNPGPARFPGGRFVRTLAGTTAAETALSSSGHVGYAFFWMSWLPLLQQRHSQKTNRFEHRSVFPFLESYPKHPPQGLPPFNPHLLIDPSTPWDCWSSSPTHFREGNDLSTASGGGVRRSCLRLHRYQLHPLLIVPESGHHTKYCVYAFAAAWCSISVLTVGPGVLYARCLLGVRVCLGSQMPSRATSRRSSAAASGATWPRSSDKAAHLICRSSTGGEVWQGSAVAAVKQKWDLVVNCADE